MTKKWYTGLPGRGEQNKELHLQKYGTEKKNVWRVFTTKNLSFTVAVWGWTGIFTFTDLLGVGFNRCSEAIAHLHCLPAVLEGDSFLWLRPNTFFFFFTSMVFTALFTTFLGTCLSLALVYQLLDDRNLVSDIERSSKLGHCLTRTLYVINKYVEHIWINACFHYYYL